MCVRLKPAHALLGRCRESLQRRKFSISIALKRVFILGRFNEADFAQTRRFCGRNHWLVKGIRPRGESKVCGEESIDSQFPHVKKCAEKEGKLRGKLFCSSEERRESGERKISERGKLEASIGTVKSMCNVIQFTTVRRGRTASYLLFSFTSLPDLENIRLRERSSV